MATFCCFFVLCCKFALNEQEMAGYPRVCHSSSLSSSPRPPGCGVGGPRLEFPGPGHQTDRTSHLRSGLAPAGWGARRAGVGAQESCGGRPTRGARPRSSSEASPSLGSQPGKATSCRPSPLGALVLSHALCPGGPGCRSSPALPSPLAPHSVRPRARGAQGCLQAGLSRLALCRSALGGAVGSAQGTLPPPGPPATRCCPGSPHS